MSSKVSSPLSMPSRWLIHWACMLALLASETTWLTLRFDAISLASATSGSLSITILSRAGDILKIGVTFVALTILMSGPRMTRQALGWVESGIHYRWWFWLLLHGISFLFFVALTGLIYSHPENPSAYLNYYFIGWLLLGFITLLFWLNACLPMHAWQTIAHHEFWSLLAALLIALVGWILSMQARELWLHLADQTLALSHFFMNVFYSDVVYEPEIKALGTSIFQVEINTSCSGYEGITLISCFLAVYLWLQRDLLHFPWAFLLFPIGIAIIWVANSLRIVALIAVGDAISPDIAVSGFHSQAGWITFTLVAFGLVAFVHRARIFSMATTIVDRAPASQTGQLATALIAPFLVLMASTMLARAFIVDFNYFYPLITAVTALALWYFRHHYAALIGFTRSWEAVGIGILVFLAWIALDPDVFGTNNEPGRGFSELPVWAAAAWLIFRIFGFVLLVPVVEELMFRGYLLRKLIAGNFESVPIGRFTWLSFLVSSLLFGLLHDLWLAGTLAGMAYALAVYRRGRLGDAIIAHMTTNALIVLLHGVHMLLKLG